MPTLLSCLSVTLFVISADKQKAARIIPNIKSPELINTPSVRGRPSRSLENKYYRRVIVGKDGSVEAAEVTERNFVRQVDPNSMLVARQKLTIPKTISYPGMPGGEFNLNEPNPEMSKAAVSRHVHFIATSPELQRVMPIM